jgi:hypothetical protein
VTSDLYFGIDGGTTGGIAIIYGSTGDIHELRPMPLKNGMIDGSALGSILCAYNDWTSVITVAIEDCPMHAKSALAIRSMGISFGIIYGLACRELPSKRIITVRSGNPKDSWQRAVLGKVPQGGTKAAAFEKARKIWPDQEWPTKWPRGTVPHDGLIDAALIAHHARNLDLAKP